MFIKASEKGQALILITLAAVGLFAFAALAIDGSMAFSNKRHAQNAADTAALAGALAWARGNDIDDAATLRAKDNGYETNGTTTEVLVTVTDVPEEDYCPGDATGKDITVTIVSHMNTTFSKIIGRDQIDSGATAVARACGFKLVPMFDGNAIVGLSDQTECGFDTGQGNAEWKVKGGGIFSNGCGNSKKVDSVTFADPGTCLTLPTGGTIKGTWSCTPQAGHTYDWAEYVDAYMPPNPCDGDADDVGITPLANQTEFKDGVYCIDKLDDFDKENIILDNATLYVTRQTFSLRFSGSGGLFGTPTQAGSYPGSDAYDGFYMVVEPISNNPNDFCQKASDNHSQVLEWKGNGEGTFYGTIFAPTACLDLRGNGHAEGLHSQIIGWIVGSNGTANTYVNYQADENHQIPYSPSISLLE